jgi:acyl carrier protein
MKAPTPNDVCAFLTQYLNVKLCELGMVPMESLSDECDLLVSGVIDSLGFVEMITAAGEYFSHEIDLTSLDPEKMTVTGYLTAFIVRQLSESSGQAAVKS